MVNNKQTPDYINEPQTLVVTRNGFIDDEYYDAIYVQKRKEALHEASKQLVADTLHVSRAVTLGLGKAVVYMFTPDSMRPAAEQ